MYHTLKLFIYYVTCNLGNLQLKFYFTQSKSSGKKTKVETSWKKASQKRFSRKRMGPTIMAP